MSLIMSFKYKDYELRACPKHLARFSPEEKNTTIDFVKWNTDSTGRKYCFSLAYFVRDSEGYDLRFVGSRPFEYIADEDVKIVWSALKHAQEILNEFFHEEVEV